MKKLVLLFVLFVSVFSYGQESYKYVVIPKKFDFFKEENKYNLNVLTKSFFEKEGFLVFYDTDELPKELANNRCSMLFLQAFENNSIFTTKITFEIKDCQNKLVLTSEQGESRDKEYEKAYNESFREALISMRGQLNLKSTVSAKSSEVPEVPSETKITSKATVVVNEDQLFAIPTSNGYKLVNSEPKTIMTLQLTSIDSVYIAKKDEISGTFLKKNNGWFFEYYEGDKLISEKVNVKF